MFLIDIYKMKRSKAVPRIEPISYMDSVIEHNQQRNRELTEENTKFFKDAQKRLEELNQLERDYALSQRIGGQLDVRG